MTHGRQLRLFLADGTTSGPRFYEIVNRTIQALLIPATRIRDLVSGSWAEVQKPGVYLIRGLTDTGEERLYVGKGENIATRLQNRTADFDFEITSLLLFTSKDENLNASQVGWLESQLIRAARDAKKITATNSATPAFPTLPKAELATISEFYEDLVLIAQTAGFDFFSAPREIPAAAPSTPATPSTITASADLQITPPEFIFHQPNKNLTARGYPSDEGFIVKLGSDASANPTAGFKGGYPALRLNLIEQGVLVPKPGALDLLTFAVDYSFNAPSAAAAIVAGNNMNGKIVWKTSSGQTLGAYLEATSGTIL